MLIAIMLSVIMPSAFIFSVSFLYAGCHIFMCSVVMPSIVMLNVIMLSVIMLP